MQTKLEDSLKQQIALGESHSQAMETIEARYGEAVATLKLEVDETQKAEEKESFEKVRVLKQNLKESEETARVLEQNLKQSEQTVSISLVQHLLWIA